MAPQACPYDLIVEMDKGLVRVQVKATAEPRRLPNRAGVYPGYIWQVRRAGRNHGLVGARRIYAPGDFDILALVALDTRQIAYLEPEFASVTIHIRSGEGVKQGRRGGGKKTRTFADHSFDRAFAEWIANGQ
jgi:hypothetical protein